MNTIDHAQPAPVASAPTEDDVRDLLAFLAANADVARADGEHKKVEIFSKYQATVRALAAHAERPDTTVGRHAGAPAWMAAL